MEKIFIYKNGKVKLIYNEHFAEKDYSEEYITGFINHETRIMENSFSIGIELMVHKGGRICYGMLAAQVRPNIEANSVKMSVAVTPQNTVKYSESILLNDEYVYRGLPKEYVAHIINCIKQSVCEKEVYPQYEVLFNYAANCEVGSSPRFFGYIAEIIMDILYSDSMEKVFGMDAVEFADLYLGKIGFKVV